MSAARTVPDHVRGVQIDAANPEVSAFVSANAGSGKTYVLAQRVINLLLCGVDPAKILCITFTKTAAANMANEVFKRLAVWTALDDAALDEQIRLSTGKTPSAGERARARRLFASALETPGGLKVQTIHAFCTRLLHQFPFEANVAARFTVLARADLFDDQANKLGKHYAGPTWEANDGSKVVGEVLTKDNGPDPAAIPWLLLRAKEHAGMGIFSKIASVQRLNTKGGKAPANGCTQAKVGTEVRIPYTADYYFYGAGY